MKLPLRVTAFTISFILAVLCMALILLLALSFIGVCVLFSPVIILYAIYFLTHIMYEEMMRYIERYSFSKYEMIEDKN
jgi:uncharacterized membrane protein